MKTYRHFGTLGGEENLDAQYFEAGIPDVVNQDIIETVSSFAEQSVDRGAQKIETLSKTKQAQDLLQSFGIGEIRKKNIKAVLSVIGLYTVMARFKKNMKPILLLSAGTALYLNRDKILRPTK